MNPSAMRIRNSNAKLQPCNPPKMHRRKSPVQGKTVLHRPAGNPNRSQPFPELQLQAPQNNQTYQNRKITAAKNPSHTLHPTPVRSAIRSMRFIVPRNRSRVLSNVSFILSARAEESRISSPMATVIYSPPPQLVSKGHFFGRDAGWERCERGDVRLSASSPSHSCPRARRRSGSRVRRARRRCIALCVVITTISQFS